jgi:hypothetical protein
MSLTVSEKLDSECELSATRVWFQELQLLEKLLWFVIVPPF